MFFIGTSLVVPYGGWFKYMDRVKAFQQENPDQPLLSISYEDMTLVRMCYIVASVSLSVLVHASVWSARLSVCLLVAV